MTKAIRSLGALGISLALTLPALAETAPTETPDIVIDGGAVTLPTVADAPAHLEGALGDKIYSGWLFRDAETRAMQEDDFANPSMAFVDQGIEAWNTVDGTEGKSCASCHNEIESMKGVRAVMPKVNAAGGLWSMENYINDCRTNRMGAEAWKWSSQPMENMTLAISLQSRGMPVDVAIDGPAKPFWEKGKEIYYTRYGQLELSCANCHQQNYGQMIRADHLSQGQTNGFPVFRINGAGTVSLHERFSGCIRDTRAEPFEQGSQEFRDLELYVASRGNGLPVEGASVRH